MEPTSTGKLTVVSEDVLYYLMKKLSFKDLLTCRLVNKLWCTNATSILKLKTKSIKLGHNALSPPSSRLEHFARCIENADHHRPLPFGNFTFYLCGEPVTPCPFIKSILDKIKTEKCYSLKIKYNEEPEGTPEDQRVRAMSRQGCVSFAHLEKLEFKMVSDWENFDVEYVNMSELLQRSQGIRTLNIKLWPRWIITMEEIRKNRIVCSLFTAIMSPHNNFRWLSSLGISYEYLDEDHLQMLAEWNHPLARLALGTFHVANETIPFPSCALHDILSRRSDTLKYLRIQITDDEQLTSVEKPGMLEVHPNRVVFPVMQILESLEIQSEEKVELVDTKWALRLNENSLPKHFPKLRKFRLVGFKYSTGHFCRESAAFLPDLRRPSLTVEEVCLPDPTPDVDCNRVLMYHMLNLFPSVRVFEMDYSRKAVETVFSSMPTLEKLVLKFGYEVVPLDEILTGVPDLPENLSHDEALVYDIESRRVAPSISMLKNLQELYLIAAEDSVATSDVTAYRVLMKMENFCRLTVLTWKNLEWSFSHQCMNAMKPRIQLSWVQLYYGDNFLSFTEGRTGPGRFR